MTDFMLNILTLLVNSVMLILLGHIFIILHELGHALPLIILTKNSAEIVSGKGKRGIKLKLGRIILRIHSIPWGGLCHRKGTDKPEGIVLLLVYLGGPLVQAIVGTLLFFVGINTQITLYYASYISLELSKLLVYLGLFNGLMFLMSMIPVTYPEWFGADNRPLPADGLNILQLINRWREERKNLMSN